jgi:uncharacterized protein with GYD domain
VGLLHEPYVTETTLGAPDALREDVVSSLASRRPFRSPAMVRYLTLVTFTDEGISAIEKTITRAAEFCKIVEESGGKVLSQYWSVGEVDGCFVFEAPDETTAAALLLGLGKEGHVRTRTMRVYNEQEFQQVLSKT